MKFEKIIIPFLIVLEAATLQRWYACINFKDYLHFSMYDVSLQLIDLTHNDKGLPIWVVRGFHNKVIQTSLALYKEYLQFWDISFLINLVTLSGYVGIGMAGWYFLKKQKRWFHWVIVFFFIFIPFLEIFSRSFSPFFIRISYLIVPYQILSLWGIWQFCQHVRNSLAKVIILVLFLVSVWWYFSMSNTVNLYCVYH